MDNMDCIREAKVGRDEIGIWWIGQSGYVIKTTEGKILFVDPYLSNSVAKTLPDVNRLYPPPILPEEIVCDAMLCTHDHMDHLDEETIIPIKNKEKITFAGPRNCCRHYRKLGIPLKNVVKVDAGEETELDGIKIRGIFTIPLDEETIDGVGYLLTFPNGIRVYHSGDTDYSSFLQYLKKYNVDIALVCINGKYKNMNAAEAALLTSQMNAKLAIPHHYDMFAGNREDPQLFLQELNKINPDIQCEILQVMQEFIYKKTIGQLYR